MASRMRGVKGFRKALKGLDTDLKENIYGAVKQTVDAVHARGKSNLSSMVTKRTGTLEKNYRRSASRKSLQGRVGYLSAKAKFDAFYARFINDGTRYITARPFHTNAVEAEREADTQRMVKARDRAIEDMISRNLSE